MCLARRRVAHLAIFAPRAEQIFDHGRRTEEIQAGEKQFGIGGQALKDDIRQFQPLVSIRLQACCAVRLQQGNQIADEQGHVHRIREMCQGDYLPIVVCPAGLPGAVSKLRSQVAAGERGARLVNLSTVVIHKRSGHSVGNHKVRFQVRRERTLCNLYQPPRIADERGHARRVQQVEKPLNLLQARRRHVVALIPDPQAQVRELAKDKHGVNAPRIRDPAVSSRPSIAIPYMLRVTDEAHGIDLARIIVRGQRVEALGQMGRCQLTLQAGTLSRHCGRFEETPGEDVVEESGIGPLRGRLSPHIQQPALDVIDDLLAAREELPQQLDVIGERETHFWGFSLICSSCCQRY